MAKYQLSYTGAEVLAMLESIAGKAEADALAAEITARETAVSDEIAARQAADALKAPLASPALTGTPTVPTAATATSSTQAASTAFVHSVVNAQGGARIASGSYTGTGTYGSSSPNSLTFSFTPKLLIIFGYKYLMSLVYNAPSYYFWATSSWDVGIITSWGTNVRWYSDSDFSQQNASGYTYYYIAIG